MQPLRGKRHQALAGFPRDSAAIDGLKRQLQSLTVFYSLMRPQCFVASMWPLPSTGISLNAKGSLESSPVLPRFSRGSGLGWCDVAGMPCDASLCFSIILRSPFRNGFQSACLLLAAIVVWPCLEKATYCLIASDLNVLLRAYGVPLAELLPRCKRQVHKHCSGVHGLSFPGRARVRKQ